MSELLERLENENKRLRERVKELEYNKKIADGVITKLNNECSELLDDNTADLKRIEALQKTISDLKAEREHLLLTIEELQAENAELQEELEVKENLLTIKNGLCKSEKNLILDDLVVRGDGIKSNIWMNPVSEEQYAELKCENEKLRTMCVDMSSHHDDDCILINRLQTTVEVLSERLTTTREVCGL